MPKKGENILKRRDGHWKDRYTKGYVLSGKIKYGFCYGKTYKEANGSSSQQRTDSFCTAPTWMVVLDLVEFCVISLTGAKNRPINTKNFRSLQDSVWAEGKSAFIVRGCPPVF